VLAGAAIEALLLFELEKCSSANIAEARGKWNSASKRPGDAKPRKDPPKEVERWELVEMAWVAHYGGIISEEAAAAADVARDFRNLIHPAKERRTAPSDEGTAMSALGAASRVAAELEARAGKAD
jgi:hypothetical protein